MKNILFVTVMVLAGLVNAQSISFSYSPHGNMIQRCLKVSSCRLANPFSPKDSVLAPVNNFRVYPNPANDHLTVEGKLPDDVKEAKVRLIGLNGQVLKSDTYTGTAKSLPVYDLQQGMYLLEMSYGKDKKEAYKIVVTY